MCFRKIVLVAHMEGGSRKAKLKPEKLPVGNLEC